MQWPETLVQGLKRLEVSVIPYVADTLLGPALRLIEADPFFRMVTLTREEEGMGVLTGVHVGGLRGALFMQSSGLGNTFNGLGSLVLPYQIPMVMVISMRGDIGDFNVAQAAMAMAARPMLDALGIRHVTPNSAEELGQVLPWIVGSAYADSRPVAILLPTRLTGGKPEVKP